MSAQGKTPWKAILVAFVAIVAAAGLGYLAWQQRTQLLQVRGQLSTANKGVAQLKAAEGKVVLCNGELKKVTARCETAEKSITAMQSDLSATRSELDQLRKQKEVTAKRLAAFKELTDKFKKMIDSGRVDVVIRNGRMMVKMPASVLFDSGKAELSRDGELALMEVAIVLRALSDRTFLIEGHTDNRPVENAKGGRFKNNWELSTARAVTVVQFMIEAKMKPENLIAAGRGEFDPVTDNKSAKGLQENRRIEIVLLPQVEEVPEASSDEDGTKASK